MTMKDGGHMGGNKHALYRFYGEDGKLLYIGITNDPGRRFAEHTKEKHWWTRIRNISVDWYKSRGAVLAAEKRAIGTESPLYNVRDKPTCADGTSEPDYEGLVHLAAASTAAGDREVPTGFFEATAAQVKTALTRGYSYREIIAAAETVYWREQGKVTDYLPPYPGQMSGPTVEELNDAHIYLAAFIPDEIDRFMSQARAEPEMVRAHTHEITIRAYEIARQSTTFGKRDLKALRAFLLAFPDGRKYLDRAQEASGRDALFPLSPDCREVIEKAVAWKLNTWIPQEAPTSDHRWLESAALAS